MEYCSGHGLIDFMNTRLREMLSEAEIIQIACDIGLGVANMHYLSPPLIHRDLKIENVLISGDGVYKLCDFGSVSVILRPPRNATEFQILDNDIQSHTTAQYRSPEMIDISRGFPIDEKSDIWAFGVFIYKLCYYTTPFEREGNLAILNASFTFPPKPAYSDRLKRIINVCLSEDPRLRPNIFQCVKELFSMRGMEVPIQDVYTAPTSTVWKKQVPTEDKRRESLPLEAPVSTESPKAEIPPPVPSRGAVNVKPVAKNIPKPIPDVKPMYRGRPQPAVPQKSTLVASKAIATENDPFTDVEKQVREDAPDDIESKYPTIEQLTNSMSQSSFNFSGASSAASYSQTSNAHGSKSLPSSVTQTPVPNETELNLRPSALAGSPWAPSAQKQPDTWAPRPVMVSHSTSPITSRASTPVQSQRSKPKVPPRTYDISSSSDEEDEERPSVPAKSIPPQPLSAVSRGQNSNDSARPTSQQVESSTPSIPIRRNVDSQSRQQLSKSSEDRENLKAILTGLSEKNTTVDLENDNGKYVDSRFLAVEKDPTSHSWRSRHNKSPSGHNFLSAEKSGRSRSHSRHRRTASSSFKKIGDAFKKFEPSRPDSTAPSQRTSLENRRSYEKQDSDSDSDNNERSSDPVAIVRETSFMESEDATQFKRPAKPNKTVTPVKPSATATATIQKSETLPAKKGKPTSAIQKRIQAYINRSPSPPPRRTATGYGQYTDSYSEADNEDNYNTGGDHTNGGNQGNGIDRKPPPKVPAKPKHLLSRG